MIDYEDYLERGGILTETEFQDRKRTAQRLFDRITCFRLVSDTPQAVELKETYRDAIEDAMFELIDSVPSVLEAIAVRESGDEVKSFSNGVTSFTFDGTASGSVQTSAETETVRRVREMLPVELVSRAVTGGEW